MRAILYAQARSGSTLLQGALAQHPEILMPGELFHNQGKCAEFNMREFGLEMPTWTSGGRSQGEWMRDFFDRYEAKKPVVGFKILTHQIMSPDACFKMNGIRVMISTIRHPLARLVSHKQALQTNNWNLLSDGRGMSGQLGTPRPAQPVILTESEILSSLNRFEHHIAFLNNWRTIKIRYQDLVHDFIEQVQSLCRRLGVQDAELSRPTIKLRDWDVSARIKNWEQVAHHFVPVHGLDPEIGDWFHE